MFPFEDLSLVLLIVSYAQLEVEPQEQEVLVVEPQELEEQPQQLDVEQEHQAFMAASSSSTISRISKVSTSRFAISFIADISFRVDTSFGADNLFIAEPFCEYAQSFKCSWK